jgi:hypothetical protein
MLRKNEVQSVIRQTIMEHRHLGPMDALSKCADAVNAAVGALLEPGQTTSGYSVGDVHPTIVRDGDIPIPDGLESVRRFHQRPYLAYAEHQSDDAGFMHPVARASIEAEERAHRATETA